MNKTIKTAVAATAVAAGAVLGTGAATAAPAPGPAVVQAEGPSPCPVCGATFPDTDQGWMDRAKHGLAEWWNIIAQMQKDTIGTGSAG